jgi:hypothetical protein
MPVWMDMAWSVCMDMCTHTDMCVPYCQLVHFKQPRSNRDQTVVTECFWTGGYSRLPDAVGTAPCLSIHTARGLAQAKYERGDDVSMMWEPYVWTESVRERARRNTGEDGTTIA